MKTQVKKVDKLFLFSVIILTVFGFFIFISASLGLLARDAANFRQIVFNQTVFGLIMGTIALILLSRIDYHFWGKYSFYFFLLSIILTLLVFLPGFGYWHGGAKRWLSLGSFSFQPAELLKLGFVFYFAAWLSGVKKNISKFHLGILPFLIMISIIGVILFKQPDMGTFVIIFAAGFGMFIAANARWRDVLIIIIIGILAFMLIAYNKPYIKDRIATFIDPSRDSLGSSYQLKQSLIAIGSGGVFGRGLGQSIQKFGFLPEPAGDSVFAVVAEEFGLVGSIFLVSLFLFFAFRGLVIAKQSPDLFGGLLTVGIVILVVSQSFFNMASMLGIVPLSGLPLLFVSHGGTALFLTLASSGIVLNVSRQ